MVLIKRIFTTVILFFALSTHASPVLHDLAGREISFSELQGKWILINYWASWCQPCLDEIAELNLFYEKNKHKNVVLYAVNYDALPVEAQQQLVKQLDIRYPSLEDPARALRLGHIRGVPVTFVFNPQGKLADTLYGGQTLESLKQAVAMDTL